MLGLSQKGKSTVALSRCDITYGGTPVIPTVDFCVCATDVFVDTPFSGTTLDQWANASDPLGVLTELQQSLASQFPMTTFVVDRGVVGRKDRDVTTSNCGEICGKLVPDTWYLITNGDEDEGCTVICRSEIHHKTAFWKEVKGTVLQDPALVYFGIDPANLTSQNEPEDDAQFQYESRVKIIEICCRREYLLGQNECPAQDLAAIDNCVNNQNLQLLNMDPLPQFEYKVTDTRSSINNGIAELCFNLESAGTFGSTNMQWPVLDNGSFVNINGPYKPEEVGHESCPITIPAGWQ